MFTGLVEEIGILQRRQAAQSGATMQIGAKYVLEDCKLGDSIMVDGACLTVVDISPQCFSVFVSDVTLATTTLAQRPAQWPLHLERAMTPQSRFGGHIVSGHIDGLAKVIGRQQKGEVLTLAFELPESLLSVIADKGSVALDGVSLTISAVRECGFEVTIIPQTQKSTHLPRLKIGDSANMETDILAKYIQRNMSFLNGKITGKLSSKAKESKPLTLADLSGMGY